jgi:hypothetical protein
MGKRVKIKSRLSDVFLPDGHAYDAGQEVVLTDAEYALLGSAVASMVTVLGTEADPNRPSAEPVTQGDIAALETNVTSLGTNVTALGTSVTDLEASVSGKVTASGSITTVHGPITQAAYDALATKDPATLYVIVG